MKKFTLIELLIVIVIIAILISLLMPALHRAKYKAKVVACMSQLKQLGIATEGYLKDNKHRYPPTPKYSGNSLRAAWAGEAGDGSITGYQVWDEDRRVLNKYIGNSFNVTKCPASDGGRYKEAGNTYGANIYSKGNYNAIDQGTVKRWRSRVISPSDMVLMANAGAYKYLLNLASYKEKKFSYHKPNTTNILFVDGHVIGVQELEISRYNYSDFTFDNQ